MKFGIDMAKAKEIHRNNIRRARKSKLAALDIDFQRALETSSDTSSIVLKKQALRDAPNSLGITTAVDTNHLKTLWDTDLLGESPYN